MAGYEVVTSAVRAEATKWDKFAAEIEPVHRVVSGMDLTPLAFFVFDPVSFVTFNIGLPTPPEELQRAYEDVRVFIETLCSGAKAEFSEIGGALIKTAEEYEKAEQVTEFDLKNVY